MALRGGMIGILLIGGALYFTDAGSVAWEKIKGLGDNCYVALSRTAPSIANPICGAVVQGIGGLERMGASVSNTLDGWKQGVFGTNTGSSQGPFMQALRAQVASLTSSKEQLMEMVNRGPRFAVSDSTLAQFQQAVDSFEIGQRYLNDPNQTSQAVPWLRSGAAQPQGFGLMSQLTLGNLYAQGGQGVPANPQLAQTYLQQAKDSLATLTKSNTAQAQQLLRTLPVSPQALKQQLDQAMQGLKK